MACGVPLVVQLKMNAFGLVIELQERWHATIRSYAYLYVDYSQWDFGLHSKRIIEGLKNRIANKAFRYVLIPLQVRVVKIYLQTHIVETWSRWCRTWRGNGYKDGSKPWKSCPYHVWKSCLRFWKLAEGMEGLARSSYARSCAQFVSTSGIVPNMSRMHELVIFCVHFFGRVICNQF